MMNKILIISCLLLSGCEFILPNTSKAITEQKQLEELQRQNSILIDMANSLKRIANKGE